MRNCVIIHPWHLELETAMEKAEPTPAVELVPPANPTSNAALPVPAPAETTP